MPRMADIPADLAQALLQDGDARLEPVATGGRNRYGCTVRPDPGLLQLASSTASTISEAGWQAALAMHQGWLAATAPVSLADSIAQVHRQLRALVQCPDDVRLSLTASGTDAHHLLVRAACADQPLCLIVPETAETGSGVASALAGPGVARMRQYRLRDAEGQPLGAESMALEIEPWLVEAVRDGLRVLLIQTDVSKTGLMAPHRSLVEDWRARFGDALLLAVDACQLRMPPDRLAVRLQQGEAVLLTGSKFMAGPSFSGALLLPPGMGWQDIAETELRPGLLLRWAAALREMQDFTALPEQAVAHALARLGGKIAARLDETACFRPYPVRLPDALPGETTRVWQKSPSLFVTGLRHAQGDLLDEAQVRNIYLRMQFPLADAPGGKQRVLVGQPVWCGSRGSQPALALRLALSSRMLVDAVTVPGEQVRLEQQIVLALDKLAWLVDRIAQG